MVDLNDFLRVLRVLRCAILPGHAGKDQIRTVPRVEPAAPASWSHFQLQKPLEPALIRPRMPAHLPHHPVGSSTTQMGRPTGLEPATVVIWVLRRLPFF